MHPLLPHYEKAFRQLYGNDDAVLQKQHHRYGRLLSRFESAFGQSDLHLFSAPGRTEIGGNHTDHNHGRVLAASVNLDSIAIVSPNEDDQVVLYSEGYNAPFIVDLGYPDIVEQELGTTTALIRGIAARFRQLGYAIGGFNACMTSDVLPGSGLSSSASVEVLIGFVFNTLYNSGKIPMSGIAMIGQYAENRYFGKPCGLMDQMACAVGGIISIDFQNPDQPAVEQIDFDFSARRYRLLVVDTGGDHADLTDDYAAVPREMKSVARALGGQVCRQIEYENLLRNMKSLRESVGDRALLRALHFLQENERVSDQAAALEKGDFESFLSLVSASGNSSFKWLQNIFATRNVREQGVALALNLTETYIGKTGGGACRVHGGGFAGTIQVFLPDHTVAGYVKLIEAAFGDGKVMVLSIRPRGAVQLIQDPHP